jgi:hypothetical protein
VSDEPVGYTITEKGEIVGLNLRVRELEAMLRHFDRASMNLHLYVRTVEGLPDRHEWDLIVEQIADMVDAYGPRNAGR